MFGLARRYCDAHQEPNRTEECRIHGHSGEYVAQLAGNAVGVLESSLRQDNHELVHRYAGNPAWLFPYTTVGVRNQSS
jgi:hypothetical protein